MAGEERAGRLYSDTRGVSTVEYTIVLALIAAAAVTSWRAFGDDLLGHLARTNTSIRDHMTVGKEER
jgi:Flp pilus assembly pilin Flp